MAATPNNPGGSSGRGTARPAHLPVNEPETLKKRAKKPPADGDPVGPADGAAPDTATDPELQAQPTGDGAPPEADGPAAASPTQAGSSQKGESGGAGALE